MDRKNQNHGWRESADRESPLKNALGLIGLALFIGLILVPSCNEDREKPFYVGIRQEVQR